MARKDIWVGPPGPVVTLYGPTNVNAGVEVLYDAIAMGVGGFNYGYQWTVSPWASMTYYDNWAKITFQKGAYTLYCTASNACGSTTSQTINIKAGYVCYPYPNPFSSYITLGLSVYGTYTFRVYDMNNTLLLQQTYTGSSIGFDTSSYPNGTYILHLYEGSTPSGSPEVHTLIKQ